MSGRCWITSWPGGQTAFDTEAEAETHAARIVREGTTTKVVVWELETGDNE